MRICSTDTLPLRDRFFTAGLLWFLFVATLLIAWHVSDHATSPIAQSRGDDLLPSYMAGVFVEQGRPDLLMDLSAAQRYQAYLRRTEGLEQHGRTGPWLNPPFYAWLFVPLAKMPYHTAQRAWFTFNLLMLFGAFVLLARMLPTGVGAWKRRSALVLVVGASMPFLMVLASQQNTCLSLLILSAAMTCWLANRRMLAGVVAGLLLFKPQLAAVFAATMAVCLGWRAAVGLAMTGTTLLGVTVATLPGTIHDYLMKLPTVLPFLTPGRAYHWERQATFQGFWRLIFQGPVSGPAPAIVQILWPICAALVAIGIGALLWRSGSRRNDLGVIAACILSMPLVMPYFMDYDLLLLAVPAVVMARQVVSRGLPLTRIDRICVAAWTALFFWLFVGPALPSAWRVSLTVPLLATLTASMIIRAFVGLNSGALASRPAQNAETSTSDRVLLKAA